MNILKLTSLAMELHIDPIELMELLLKCPTPVFDGGPPLHGDIYSMQIVSYYVDAARQFVLEQSAREVIAHVKSKGKNKVEEFLDQEAKDIIFIDVEDEDEFDR